MKYLNPVQFAGPRKSEEPVSPVEFDLRPLSAGLEGPTEAAGPTESTDPAPAPEATTEAPEAPEEQKSHPSRRGRVGAP